MLTALDPSDIAAIKARFMRQILLTKSETFSTLPNAPAKDFKIIDHPPILLFADF